MKKLKVVITAGGTREPVDDIRVMTNVSTGKLGAKIADKFTGAGHNVYFVHPFGSVLPSLNPSTNCTIDTVSELMEMMEMLVPQSDVIIHSMAVSDFSFKFDTPVKISSESPEALVEHIRKSIQLTPKVISNFRAWNQKAILVGFKFTVGKGKEELLAIALKLMADNRLDMVFANDKSRMQKSGDHVGTLLMPDWNEELHGKDDIAESIYENTMRLAGSRF